MNKPQKCTVAFLTQAVVQLWRGCLSRGGDD